MMSLGKIQPVIAVRSNTH